MLLSLWRRDLVGRISGLLINYFALDTMERDARKGLNLLSLLSAVLGL